MKLLLCSLILAASAFAQPAVTVAIKIGAAAPQTVALPPVLVSSLQAFVAAQTIPNPADGGKTQIGKYADVADLILSDLKTALFRNVLVASPPAAIVTKQAAVTAAQADLEAAKTAALP